MLIILSFQYSSKKTKPKKIKSNELSDQLWCPNQEIVQAKIYFVLCNYKICHSLCAASGTIYLVGTKRFPYHRSLVDPNNFCECVVQRVY